MGAMKKRSPLHARELFAAAAVVLMVASIGLPIQAHAQNGAKPSAASAVVAAIPRYADGSINFNLWLSGKTPAEVGKLGELLHNRKDMEDLSDFLDQLDAENRRKGAALAKSNEEFLATLKAIHQLTGGKLDQAMVSEAKKVLQDPSVSDSLKVELRKLLN